MGFQVCPSLPASDAATLKVVAEKAEKARDQIRKGRNVAWRTRVRLANALILGIVRYYARFSWPPSTEMHRVKMAIHSAIWGGVVPALTHDSLRTVEAVANTYLCPDIVCRSPWCGVCRLPLGSQHFGNFYSGLP